MEETSETIDVDAGVVREPGDPDPAAKAGKRVAVFGAGIAGLTAAQELVERGYDVSLFDQGTRQGGKAASFEGPQRQEAEHGFRFFPGFYRNVVETLDRIPVEREPDDRRIPTVYGSLIALPEAVFSAGSINRRKLTGWGRAARWAAWLVVLAMVMVAIWLGRWLDDLGFATDWLGLVGRLALVLTIVACLTVAYLAISLRRYLTRAMRSTDEVQKLPIKLPERKDTPRPTAVADRSGRRLVNPVAWVAALWHLFRLTRKIPASVRPGITESLFAFFSTARIITSSRERLYRNYENQSWWGYIRAWRFSQEYRLALATGLTRTFVATRAEEMSARTGGQILAQLMYDISPQFRRPPADRILQGPTDEAWIRPWIDHLHRLGPGRFRLNPVIRPGEAEGSAVRLVRFVPDPDEASPSIRTFEYARAPRRGISRGDGPRPGGPKATPAPPELFDHYLLAISATGAQDVLANSPDVLRIDAERVDRPEHRLEPNRFGRPLDENELADVGPPAHLAGIFGLQFGWMNGIVFHLDRIEPELPRGHVLCLSSDWALTALDQAPVWDAAGPHELKPLDRRSIVSVNISDWFLPDRHKGLPARYSALREINETTWAQLQSHLPELADVPYESVVLDDAIGDPLGDDLAAAAADEDDERATLHGRIGTGNIDDRIRPRARGRERRALTNAERLLINTERSWDNRPSARTSFANLFLAGDYVRTSSDFASMEAANESARRAVRRLLEADGDPSPPPRVYPLEEPPETRWLIAMVRTLDRGFRSIGLPHPLSFLITPLGWLASATIETHRWAWSFNLLEDVPLPAGRRGTSVQPTRVPLRRRAAV